MKLPVYKCHKEVEAFKIHSITAQALGTAAGEVEPPQMVAVPYESGVSYEPSAQKTEYVLADETGEFSVVVDEDYMGQHDVYTQGYFVRYSNGHQSFSPTAAFEEGYDLLASVEPALGNPHWWDVVVRTDDFGKGPVGHDGSTLWINNVKDSVYSVRGRSVRSVRLSGLTLDQLHPELEAALIYASFTYEGTHGPVKWEEK